MDRELKINERLELIQTINLIFYENIYELDFLKFDLNEIKKNNDTDHFLIKLAHVFPPLAKKLFLMEKLQMPPPPPPPPKKEKVTHRQIVAKMCCPQKRMKFF
jgi:hypothetical protein